MTAMAKQTDIYGPCDKAIRAMDRQNVELFGRLKTLKWDELTVIREVTKVYRKSAEQARKRFFEVAYEAFILALLMCGEDNREAQKEADKTITMKFVDDILEQTDFVTLYKFNSEMERKIARLVEALSASQNKSAEIDRALRYWSQQLGQYAINMTDYAVIQAFVNAGIVMVQWDSMHDAKVCNECYALDGQIFRINELPRKPHWGCRCTYRPVPPT